jgi:hypothetical protein
MLNARKQWRYFAAVVVGGGVRSGACYVKVAAETYEPLLAADKAPPAPLPAAACRCPFLPPSELQSPPCWWCSARIAVGE